MRDLSPWDAWPLGIEGHVMRIRRDLAARVSPWFWPAGAWLANGPAKVPVPRRKYGRWNLY
ncbi:hypothetical protein [Microbispora sp. NPDC046933]|uniref:hypothetical protein n=1 Tax=Microbispora sp. NPDC046933 TaxID=3155618 RepID=UPI0033F7D94C